MKVILIISIFLLSGCSVVNINVPLEPGPIAPPPVCGIALAVDLDCSKIVPSLPVPNCNTYALANWHRLRAAGVPARYVALQMPDGEWHMAVTDGKLVWSNTDKPVPWQWILARQWGYIEDPTTRVWHKVVSR